MLSIRDSHRAMCSIFFPEAALAIYPAFPSGSPGGGVGVHPSAHRPPAPVSPPPLRCTDTAFCPAHRSNAVLPPPQHHRSAMECLRSAAAKAPPPRGMKSLDGGFVLPSDCLGAFIGFARVDCFFFILVSFLKTKSSPPGGGGRTSAQQLVGSDLAVFPASGYPSPPQSSPCFFWLDECVFVCVCRGGGVLTAQNVVFFSADEG